MKARSVEYLLLISFFLTDDEGITNDREDSEFIKQKYVITLYSTYFLSHHAQRVTKHKLIRIRSSPCLPLSPKDHHDKLSALV